VKTWLLCLSLVLALPRFVEAQMSDADYKSVSALRDAMVHGLSWKLAGTDLHTYQRTRMNLPAGQPHDYREAARVARLPLCSDTQGPQAWLEQQCNAFAAVAAANYCPPRDWRCTAMRLAPFVVKDPALYSTVVESLRSPCSRIPDPIELSKRHGLPKVHVPGANQPADVNRSWLFCDTAEPVSAEIHPAPHGAFVMRHKRSMRGRAAH
jgi:hypothetical protein